MKIIVWKQKANSHMSKGVLPLCIFALLAVALFAVDYFGSQPIAQTENQSDSAILCDTLPDTPTDETVPVSSLMPQAESIASSLPESTQTASKPVAAESSMQAAKTPVYRAEIPLSKELQHYAYDLCQKEDVPYALTLAVIEHESNFNADATHDNTNGTTDSGLMQLNDIVKPYVKEQFGVTDLLDPRQNLTAGIGILSDYLEKYDLQQSVMAYALGESGMKQAKASGRHSTKATDEILALMEKYASLV